MNTNAWKFHSFFSLKTGGLLDNVATKIQPSMIKGVKVIKVTKGLSRTNFMTEINFLQLMLKISLLTEARRAFDN